MLITGYPKAYRHTLTEEHAIKFHTCHINVPVHGVTEHHFSCVFDMADRQLVYAETEGEWPGDYGAFSGCPAFTYSDDSVELAGVVYEGSNGFHILYMHHSDLIAGDGTLNWGG